MFEKLLCSLGISLALSFAACGGGNGSCSVSSGGNVTQCVDYGDGWNPSDAMSNCSKPPAGSYSSGSCPTQNRAGRCAVTLGALGVTQSSTISFYSPTTAASAMMQCGLLNTGLGSTSTFTAN
jgi:hypothetical protein